jgi:hypothetical protein
MTKQTAVFPPHVQEIQKVWAYQYKRVDEADRKLKTFLQLFATKLDVIHFTLTKENPFETSDIYTVWEIPVYSFGQPEQTQGLEVLHFDGMELAPQ